jgi:hypothetical protein
MNHVALDLVGPQVRLGRGGRSASNGEGGSLVIASGTRMACPPARLASAARVSARWTARIFAPPSTTSPTTLSRPTTEMTRNRVWVPVIRFTSCDLRVLMDQPTEPISPCDPSQVPQVRPGPMAA